MNGHIELTIYILGKPRTEWRNQVIEARAFSNLGVDSPNSCSGIKHSECFLTENVSLNV